MQNDQQEAQLQAAFSVSTRQFKRAVDRNKVKRLMRESYRMQKNQLLKVAIEDQKKIAIFFIYTSAQFPKFDELFAVTGSALHRLAHSITET